MNEILAALEKRDYRFIVEAPWVYHCVYKKKLDYKKGATCITHNHMNGLS